jgi:hypothetical protein
MTSMWMRGWTEGSEEGGSPIFGKMFWSCSKLAERFEFFGSNILPPP